MDIVKITYKFGYNQKRESIMKTIERNIDTILGEVKIIPVSYDCISTSSLYKKFRQIHHEEFKAIVQSKIMAIFGKFIDWRSEGYGLGIAFQVILNGESEPGMYELYVRDGFLRLGAQSHSRFSAEVFTYLQSELFD